MEFLTALFEGPLLLFTIPMIVAVLFWLTALLGLLDFESFDLDLDLDADIDADIDVDVDVDVDIDADVDADVEVAGGGMSFLHLLGLGMVPFSLIFTMVLFFFGWTGIALHSVLGSSLGWSGLSLNLLFAPIALVVAMAAAAGAARLLRPLFREYGKAHTARDLVGKVASLNSSTASATFGSAIVKVAGDRIEIAARCDPDDGEPRYGDRVLIIDYDAQKNIYQIAPYTEDESLP